MKAAVQLKAGADAPAFFGMPGKPLRRVTKSVICFKSTQRIEMTAQKLANFAVMRILSLMVFLACAFGSVHAAVPIAGAPADSMVVVRALGDEERLLRTGGGIVVAAGTVTTNCRLLAKAKQVQLRYKDLIYPAVLEHEDIERDLCQIAAPLLPAPPVRIGGIDVVRLGQAVTALAISDGKLIVSEGVVDELKRYQEMNLIRTSATVSHGVLSAGLFDAAGRLIGISTLTFNEAPDANMALSVDAIRDVPRRSAEFLLKQAAEKKALEQLPAHLPRPGDWWKYVYTDKWTGLKSGPFVYEIAAVDAKSIRENVRAAESQVGAEKTHTPAPLFSENGLAGMPEFAPFLQAFGALGEAASWSGILMESGDENKWTFEGSIAGSETVTTPAGTFEAVRVRLQGQRPRAVLAHPQYQDYATRAVIDIWYVPAVKRAVKIARDLRNFNGRYGDRDVYELVEYNVRQR